MDERQAILILNAVPGLGNRGIQRLMDEFGLASRVLSAPREALQRIDLVPRETWQSIIDFPKDNFLLNEEKLMKKLAVRAITFWDQEYPASLKNIDGAPVVLYCRGVIPENINFPVAVVGSRNASVYGTTQSYQWANRLAEHGILTVSGMARGIDTAAHKGSLAAGGRTVAVLGSGLGHIYPPENRGLFNQIIESGCVLSEFPIWMPPFGHNFPRRNRIISGLSMGVLVVEAAERSGALITADFALEQGKEVYALPGKVDNRYSQGTHNLIKQGAKIVTHIEDILEDMVETLAVLNQGKPKEAGVNQEKFSGNRLSDQEESVYNHIHNKPVHIDQLAAYCEYEAAVTMAVLLRLELKKVIKQLPGKFFARIL